MRSIRDQAHEARRCVDQPLPGMFAAALLAMVTAPALASAPTLERYPKDLSVPDGAKAGDLHIEPCRYRLAPDGRDYAADCGTLIVPENRKNGSRALIALPLVRIRATGNDPAEPIFTFKGGPGNANFISFPSSGLLERHDLVMVGYRGIDGSIKLRCPEISEGIAQAEGPMLGERAVASYAAGVRACAARLERDGVDLAGYSMVETIDDQELARRKLGYDRINLLGSSYGTRLQMIYMWRYPQSLHRVVMIGSNPPGHFVWDPHVTDQKLVQYGALCAKDAYCRTRTDDLVATIRRVSNDMPKRWLGIPIEADRVRMMSFFMSHESIDTGKAPVPSSGPVAIDMWLDAAEGDASGMALASLLSYVLAPNMTDTWGHFLAMGTSAIDYIDPRRDYEGELQPDGAIIGAVASRFLFSLVPDWPPNPDHVDYNEVQPSDIETLLIGGTLDFTAPIEFARSELLPKLSRGHLVTLREFGHTATFWNSQPQARALLLNTFFDQGRVDDSGYVYQPPVFEVDLGLDGVMRRLLAIAVSGVVVLGVLVWLSIRAIRRRAAGARAGIR